MSVGEAKASYLKNETGLDEQYFILFDKKNNEETLLKKETLKLNEFKSQKQKLVKFKDGIATTFNGQIAEKRLITEKLNKVIKSKIKILFVPFKTKLTTTKITTVIKFCC